MLSSEAQANDIITFCHLLFIESKPSSPQQAPFAMDPVPL